MKEFLRILIRARRLNAAIAAMVLSLSMAVCSSESTNDTSPDVSTIDKMSYYPYGRTKAPDAPDNFDMVGTAGGSTHLYADWKYNYVVADSGAGGYLRVQRDRASNFDTVSEGIGYGMLLAVYLNDQDTFDKLYLYCKAHFISNYGYITPLMHWKVHRDGYNVSGFADYEIDTSSKFSWYEGGPYGTQTCTSNPTAAVPHGRVYGNLTTGKIFVCPQSSYPFYDSLLKTIEADSNWYRMNNENSTASSATDADADIAAALCFAAKKWGRSRIGGDLNYLNEARAMLKAIKENDFGSGDGSANGESGTGTFIRNGSAWGGKAGWNPSYVTLAYYRYVFAEADDSSRSDFWKKVYSTMGNAMLAIKSWEQKLNGGLSNTPLAYPDWCDTSGSEPKQGFMFDQYGYRYGTKEEGNNINTLYPKSAIWKSGTSKNDYNVKGSMSFNTYYDGVRVPWRTLLAMSWGISGVRSIVDGLYYGYGLDKQQFYYVVDGFGVPSGSWDWNKRDVFNTAVGGQWHSVTFLSSAAMLQAMCTLGDGNGAWGLLLNNYYEGDNSSDPTVGTGFNYYGNTMRLFALTYMSGKMLNLYKPNKVTFQTSDGIHYLAAEYVASDKHLVADRTAPGEWETFELIDLGNNKVALRASRGEFLSAINQGATARTDRTVNATRDWCREWETFTLEDMGNDRVRLKAYDGQYLCAENGGGGVVDASRTEAAEWETFRMTVVAR